MGKKFAFSVVPKSPKKMVILKVISGINVIFVADAL
jgi:hypothetical protein